MRSAVVILSLIAAIGAEAPYHLPRPAAHSPAFQYPAPAPPPQALPPLPPPPPQLPRALPPPAPAPPAPQPNFGYHYQQPNIAPSFVYPQPQIQYQPQPAPPRPAPAPQFIPQPAGYNYPQPSPQAFLLPQPQLPPQPQPQPQFHSQPQALPQSQPSPYVIPSPSYGVPQPQFASRPSIPQSPVQPLVAPQPQPLPQPQPQPQPAQVYQPIAYYQQQQPISQSGYTYNQPAPHAAQALPQLPLQAQPLSSNSGSSSFSSYQADSHQYTGAQGQSPHEALDSVVIDRVQNIIRADEHSSARSAGFQSLVSGISLENAKPSVELTSFVHTSPLRTSAQSIGASETRSSSGSSAAVSSGSTPSADYGLPTITANSQPAVQSESSFSFLPQTQPAASYGPPNKR